METTTIRRLFSDQDRKFKIPAYQRSYSWEKENIEQFLQDLKDATQNYYLGHFLFEKDKQAPNDLLIIDGQQRLTTCIIFFSSIYEELSNRKKSGEIIKIDIDNKIRHTYLCDLLNNTDRLQTVDVDSNFFHDEIIERKYGTRDLNTKSQGRIRDARKVFAEAFQKASPNQLECWHSLVENAKCTEFHVSDKIEAAQIFAFQNDRGKGLSKLEVLKAYFMLQLYLRKQSDDSLTDHLRYFENEISSIYIHIVKIKMNRSEDDVLLYYWRAAASNSKGLNSEDVVSEVKDYLNTVHDNSEICEWIKTFIAELARSFQLVEEVEKSENPDIRNLVYLNNMALAYPFLIRARLHGASPQQFNRLGKLLENITFRYLIRGGRAEILSRLNQHLKPNVEENYVEIVVSGIVGDLRNNWWWGYWSDATVEEYLNGPMYGNRVDNYVLWRYEIHLCTKTKYPTPPKVRYEDLIDVKSIEHIAPQTPTNGEPEVNGYGFYEDKQNPQNGIVSGLWMNRLGNLMLISQSHNSMIGNRPFKDKLDSYGKDNLLNQQKQIEDFIADRANPVWDKSAIERRQRAILEAAKSIWSLDSI